MSWDDNREAYGELRINPLGWLSGRVVHMTYTERGDDLQVISLRVVVNFQMASVDLIDPLSPALSRRERECSLRCAKPTASGGISI